MRPVWGSPSAEETRCLSSVQGTWWSLRLWPQLGGWGTRSDPESEPVDGLPSPGEAHVCVVTLRLLLVAWAQVRVQGQRRLVLTGRP